MAAKKKTNRFRPSCTRRAFAKAFETDTPKIVVFCDTETEGLDPANDHIIQFSAIKYHYENGQMTEIDSIDTYIKNQHPLSEVIIEKIHITDEMLKNAPAESEVFPVIRRFMDNIDVFCAYNSDFDYAFISELYRRQHDSFKPKVIFDVMAMACDLYTMYQVQSKSLKSIANYLKIQFDKKELHDSKEDIALTVKVFEAMKAQYQALPLPIDRSGFRIPKIYRYWTWTSEINSQFNRIYFYTDCGKIFFESYDRSFGTDQKEKKYTVDDLDLDSFVTSALSYTRCANIEALAHLNPRPPRQKKNDEPVP